MIKKFTLLAGLFVFLGSNYNYGMEVDELVSESEGDDILPFNEKKITQLKGLAAFKFYSYYKYDEDVFYSVVGIFDRIQSSRCSSQKNKYFSYLMSESEKEKNRKYSSFSLIVFFDKHEKEISASSLGSESYDLHYFKNMLNSQLYVKKIIDNWEGWFLNPYGITRWSLKSSKGTTIAKFSDKVSSFCNREDRESFIKRTNLAKKYDLSEWEESGQSYSSHED